MHLALIDLHDFAGKVIVVLSKLKLSDIVHQAEQNILSVILRVGPAGKDKVLNSCFFICTTTTGRTFDSEVSSTGTEGTCIIGLQEDADEQCSYSSE